MENKIFTPQINAAISAIDGHLCPGQEQWLFEKAAMAPNESVIIEIGSYHGRSTAALGLACKGTSKKVFAFDLWPDGDLDIWLSNMRLNDLLGTVVPIIGDSAKTLPRLRNFFSRTVALTFIDGDHETAAVLKDYHNIAAVSKPGGFIAFHDICPEWQQTVDAWDHIKHELLNHESCVTIRCGQLPA
jgi:predicted O-methyltransferase YrrM